MVAIVGGVGLGLDRSSATVLGKIGQQGQLGDSTFGRYGENVTVNAANGNLIIQRTDEILLGVGPDDIISRSYNSLSANQGYGSAHSWQINDARCITGLTGGTGVNTAGSQVTRIDADGSDDLYTYDASSGTYICHQGGQAGYTLKFKSSTNVWTWTDDRFNGITETYDASNGGRLTSCTDNYGNALSYGYDSSGRLSTVTTQDGETTTLNYDSSSRLSSVVTAHDGTTTTRVYYGYDSSNRLTSVTTDLTPDNNSTTDNNVVTTNYTYWGGSDRVKTITQTGGASLTINYIQVGSTYRVQSLAQAVATGITRTTSFTYNGNTTTITDSNGQNTDLTFDSSGQLLTIQKPTAQNGNAQTRATLTYSNYDTDGDVRTVQDANGNISTYAYDSNDNLTDITDPDGNTVHYTYNSDNMVLTARRTNAAGTQSETTRYAYYPKGALRYVVDGDGEVTHYLQTTPGQLLATIVYTVDKYNLSGLGVDASIDPNDLDNWVAARSDQSLTERTQYNYDFRGNLQWTKSYSACDPTTGLGLTTQPYTTVTYQYDQFGNLLSKITSGISNQETYTYDGLGRLQTAVDHNTGNTTVVWNDGQNTCTVTLAGNLVKASTYDLAGELTSYAESGSNLSSAPRTTNYAYDDLGRLCASTNDNGHTTYWLYDNAGRKVADIAADGSMTEYRYDANNNLIASVAYYNKTTYNLLQLVGANGVAVDPPISTSGLRPTTSTNDVWKWHIYNAENRMVETINGDGSTFLWGVDNNGEMTGSTAFANVISSSTLYDPTTGFTKVLPTTPQVPTSSSYDNAHRYYYDNEGRQIGVMNIAGAVTQNVYDGAGQLVETIQYKNLYTGSRGAAFQDILTAIGTNAQDIHEHFVYDGRGLLRYKLDNSLDPTNWRPTEYDYDNAGRLYQKIEYAGSIVTPSSYTDSAVTQQIAGTSGLPTNTNNRTSWWVYDAATGNTVYAVDANGGVTQYAYDPDDTGRVIKQTQFATACAAPTQSQTTMDSWASSHASTLDRVTRSFYDAAGELLYSAVRQSDTENYVTGYTYDGVGNVIQKVQYSGTYTITDSDTTSTMKNTRMPSTPPADSLVTGYQYDNNERLLNTIDDQGGLNIYTQLAYDGVGRVSDKYVDWGGANQVRTHYDYDLDNRVRDEIVDSPSGGIQATTSYTYDGQGNVSTKTDPNNNLTQYFYDGVGNLTQLIDPLNQITTYQYDAFNNRIAETGPDGGTTYSYYDKLNRLVVRIDPNQYWTSYTYTIGNALASVTQGANAVTGTITAGVLPADSAFHKNSSIDATTIFTRDELDRVIQQTDAEQKSQYYTLDVFGDQTAVTNMLGGTTTNSFNNRGLLTSATEAIHWTAMDGVTQASTSVVTTYQYDSFGNCKTMVQDSGSTNLTTNYHYDHMNRLVLKTQDRVWVMNTNGFSAGWQTPQTTYAYDRRGNLIEQDDGTVESGNAVVKTWFFYDKLDRKVAEVNALGTYSAWTYDDNGNQKSARVYETAVTSFPPSGNPPAGNYRETLYYYDALNRLTTTTIVNPLTGFFNGSTFTTVPSTSASAINGYYQAGLVTSQRDARGYYNWTYYDLAGRKVADVDKENYLTVYTLDAFGNVASETRYANQITGHTIDGTTTLATVKGWVTADTTNDRTTTFTYDRNGRRLTENRIGVIYYTVDTTGLLSNVSIPYVGTSTITYTYNALGEVASKSYSKASTTNGAISVGDKTTYTYDDAGRQVQVQLTGYKDLNNATVQNTTFNTYDGMNNLVESQVYDANNTATMNTTYYTYGAGGRLSTMTDANNFLRTYYHDIAGRTVMVTYARQHSVGSATNEADVTQYDALGRVTMQSVATKSGGVWGLGDQVQTHYDTYGEVDQRGVNGIWQQFYTYDKAGRLSKSTDEGIAKLFLYDAVGNQTLEIDTTDVLLGNGNSLASLSIDDAIAQLTASNHTVGTLAVTGMVETATQYDRRGQAIKATAFGRQLSVDYQNNYTVADVSTSKSYNAFGEVASETDGRGYTTTYTYNTMGKVTAQILPQVDSTDEHNVTTQVHPTQYNFYDIAGRLIAVQDAEGNLNTLNLLANTGYDGSDAKVVKEYHADGGVVWDYYDVFFNLSKTKNEVGKTELYAYDGLGNLVQQTHQLRSAGVQLIDYYTYDGLGQRLSHTNNEYIDANGNPLFSETTDYDAQGRVSKTVDMDGHVTTYRYDWSPTISTMGLGTYGGWTKTTTNSANLTATESDDVDGRLTAKTDFATNSYTYTYDSAGRLAQETDSFIPVDDNPHGFVHPSGESKNYFYFNTGLKSRVASGYHTVEKESGSGQENPIYDSVADILQADYSYDKNGNELYEDTIHYVEDANAPTTVTLTESETATFDALNRLTSISDVGSNRTGTVYGISGTLSITNGVDDPMTINVKYDSNGNVRERSSTYYLLSDLGVVSGTQSSQDDWYVYDAMNRFVTTKGTYNATTHNIDMGTGALITYDLAGERKTAQTSGETDTYTYYADGYLSQAVIALTAGGSEKATYGYDLMGRVTLYREYDTSNAVKYSKTTTYNEIGQDTNDVVMTVRTDGTTTTWNTTYEYGAYNASTGNYDGAYQGGSVTHAHASQTQGGSSTTDSVYSYIWFDSAQESGETYKLNSNAPTSSSLRYNQRQDLREAIIVDGASRDLKYQQDIDGEITQRDSMGSGGLNYISGPHARNYFFGGIQVGDVSNDGTSNVDYATSITDHRTIPGGGLFQNGASTGVHYADFDQSFDAINGLTYQQSPNAYTVQGGDTLQSIAQAIWGDANFWYVLADSNGLDSSSTLVAGQTLIIPNKVENSHNSSSTYNVYNPNDAIGNVSPTHPPKPQGHHNCGVFGQILLAVVAIAVAYFTAGAALGAMGTTFADATLGEAVAAGAIGGAAGSIASQTVGVATGIQKSFNWGAVGMAAIGGAVGAGLGNVGAFGSLGEVGGAVARGVVGSIATQGIGVATGLQKSFDWAGVAAAGIGAGVMSEVGDLIGVDPNAGPSNFHNDLLQGVAGMAGLIANAATRSLINGSDFGDNIMKGLPATIGQTIGNMLAGGIQRASEPSDPGPATLDGASDGAEYSPRAPNSLGLLHHARYFLPTDGVGGGTPLDASASFGDISEGTIVVSGDGDGGQVFPVETVEVWGIKQPEPSLLDSFIQSLGNVELERANAYAAEGQAARDAVHRYGQWAHRPDGTQQYFVRSNFVVPIPQVPVGFTSHRLVSLPVSRPGTNEDDVSDVLAAVNLVAVGASAVRGLTYPAAKIAPAFLQELEGGGSWLMTEEQYYLYAKDAPIVGRADGQFLTSAARMNELLSSTNVDPVLLGEKLGVSGWSSDTSLVRVDVLDPLNYSPRLPDSALSGSNTMFRPGGLTYGGVPEVVIDPVPGSQIWATPLRPGPR